jgi:hypothetical protein
MKTETLDRRDHGTVNVELCFVCAGIWFDHLASVELAPTAVISLFKEIHAHKEITRQAVASKLGCPRCGDPLALSFDLVKSGRFSYFRCTRGDGRFTPFFQFLREKQFVRSLTAAEIQRVRAQVRQVNCSQCGAPVDLELGTECKYCHAPLSLLDPDAVEKAVKMWSEAQERQQRVPTPEAVADAMMRVQQFSSPNALPPGLHLGGFTARNGSNSLGVAGLEFGLDLVGSGIEALGHLFDSMH